MEVLMSDIINDLNAEADKSLSHNEKEKKNGVQHILPKDILCLIHNQNKGRYDLLIRKKKKKW